MLLSNQKSDVYDVVVVGGSFAGLSFASVAATLGLRVLVVERDAQIGAIVRTTGVLFSDVLNIVDVPARYLLNAVRHIHIQPPHSPPLDISTRAYRFYMVDVPGMLKWMAQQAEEHGARIRCKTMFLDAVREQDGMMQISLGVSSQAGKRETISARFLIGADGTRSRVAQCLGLDQNTHMLAGAEWLVEQVPSDRETFFLVMSHQLAPGYCVWLAPHGKLTALGVAGHPHAFQPIESLHQAQTLFREVVDMSQMHIVERKAGIIPTGGRLRRVSRDDSRGRVLLLGDAAGLCGAATGGGIYPALMSGRLAAHAVAGEVLNEARSSIQAYMRDLSYASRLGDYLHLEDWLRRVLDSMKSDTDLALLYGLFALPEGHHVLQRSLLETPIIGMDGSFFALLRGLLSRHPRLYRSAFHALWRHFIMREQTGRQST